MATGAIGFGLGGFGVLGDSEWPILAGGCFATVAAGIASLRLLQWSKRVSVQARPLYDWEFRPGFLIAVLVIAVLMACLLIAADRSDIGAWCLPAAMAWFSSVVARGRLRPFLCQVVWPSLSR